MNKKRLSLSMIVPLAAAGALTSAPGASAGSDVNQVRSSNRVSCKLDAQPYRHKQIKVDFRLSTKSFDRQIWRVEIRQNGRVIESDRARTRYGRLRVVDYTYDRRGNDNFRGYAYNRNTRQWCSDTDTVRSGRLR